MLTPGMQEVEVHHHFRAPIERVWARYTDHVSWSDWAGLGRVVLAREGVPAPNGAGCVREFAAARGLQEEVLIFDPPRRMTYRIARGGWPLADHLGEVAFTPRDGGTDVVWRCRFRSRLPGTGGLVRLGVTRAFRRALRGLERDLG
jgi:uncharacterized protein YndB with AHSA1/START domain